MRLRLWALTLGVCGLLAAQGASQSASPDGNRQAGDAARPKLELSLSKAIEIALAADGNERLQLAVEAVRQAQARKSQAFSWLLPNVDASWGARSFTEDLSALGLNIRIPGFAIPSFVGPVSVYDLRASATQTVFDFTTIRRWQASGAQVAAS
jgi:outer membrane protein TolC